jgi:hypothetical protein
MWARFAPANLEGERMGRYVWYGLAFVLGALATAALAAEGPSNDYAIQISTFQLRADRAQGIMTLAPVSPKPPGAMPQIAFESYGPRASAGFSYLTASRLVQGCASRAVDPTGCDQATFAVFARRVRVALIACREMSYLPREGRLQKGSAS